jgi:protein-tyrosine phosphatase
MSLLINSTNHKILNDIKLIYSYFSRPKYRDNFNKIIDGLYLGDYNIACSKSFIVNKNINLVINCSNDLIFPKFYKNIDPIDFQYFRIPLDDSYNQTDQDIMYASLQKACPIIYKYLKNNKNVYIHCYAGMQRSATVVLCYLIYKDYIENNSNKISQLNEYYNFVKLKRVVVFLPDPTFIKVIDKYYKDIVQLKK